MPLINEISGALIKRLSGEAGGSSASSSSTIIGRGVSSSFDGGGVNVSAGLQGAATIFSNSYIRLSDAVSRFNLTEEKLQRLSALTEELYAVASEAADSQTSTETRADLESRFQELASEFERVVADASKDTKDVFERAQDLLDVSDLRSVLSTAGVDASAATSLAESFAGVGGQDGNLGYERVTLSDTSQVNPLDQSVATLETALLAKEAIGLLREEVNTDSEGISVVLGELRAAASFALEGARAADELGRKTFDTLDAQKAADELVRRIKARTSDAALAAHSSLDTALARELLG